MRGVFLLGFGVYLYGLVGRGCRKKDLETWGGVRYGGMLFVA